MQKILITLSVAFVLCCSLSKLLVSPSFAQPANALGGPVIGGENPDHVVMAPGAKAGGVDALPVDLGDVVQMKVAGQPVGAPPLRIGNLDVLAPLQALLPRLGATLVPVTAANIPGNRNTPTEDRYFQINLANGGSVVLTIGKAMAYVDKEERPLRATPLLIRGKIWLPVFSLSPLLGAAPRLAPDGTLHLNPTVQSVELFTVRGLSTLTIKTSAPLAPRAVVIGKLDNPAKIYFDLPGYSMGFDAANSTSERVVSGGLHEVQRVRAGLLKKFPDTTRIVLDLKQSASGVSRPLPDKTLFAFVLDKSGRSASDAVVPAIMMPPRDKSLRGITIVVDAGHGGHDSGAPGARSIEKQHTLDIARRLRNILVARGANVLMTRDGDYFISLQGRVDFANSRKADLFFSVHINSYAKSSAGTETFYWTANSQFLAREVQNQLVKATGLKSRGISQARFVVIRRTKMPSVLTESCFISNPREEALLMKPEFRERVARGMAQGITNYAQRHLKPAGISS